MRRLGLVLLLPVVWVPVLLLALLAGSALPWWSWPVALLFVVLWRRRRALAGSGDVLADDGPRFSPIKGGRGF